MEDDEQTIDDTQAGHCAECETILTEDMDREITDGGVFCRSCFNMLTAQLQQELEAQSRDVNYPTAFVGAVLGGALGILAWWGFTVVTEIAFGLVAVVIGITVAKGAVIFAGNRRSRGLQIMSVVVAVVSFVYANYLVNRTFIQGAMAEEGRDVVLPLIPNPVLLINVLQISIGVMDLVFLAIVIYEAWRIPAPLILPQGAGE